MSVSAMKGTATKSILPLVTAIDKSVRKVWILMRIHNQFIPSCSDRKLRQTLITFNQNITWSRLLKKNHPRLSKIYSTENAFKVFRDSQGSMLIYQWRSKNCRIYLDYQAKMCLPAYAKCTDLCSSHAGAKSHPGSCSPLIHSIVSNDSVSGQ